MYARLKAWCDGWRFVPVGPEVTGRRIEASGHTMPQVVFLDDDDNNGDIPRPSQVSLTQEQLQRMARQKELALARRLQVEQQQQQQQAGRVLPPTFSHSPQALPAGNLGESYPLRRRDCGDFAHRSTDSLPYNRPCSGDSDVVFLGESTSRGRGFVHPGIRSTQGSCFEDPVCLDQVSVAARSSESPVSPPEDAGGWKSVRRRPVPGQSFGREVFLRPSPLEAAESLQDPRLSKKIKVEETSSDQRQAEGVPFIAGTPQNAVKAKVEIKPSQQQMQVLRAIEEGKSVFVTGSAGTGKSFLLEFAIRLLKMKHGNDTVFVTASTGMAACALGGTTLHSFAGIMPGNKSKEVLAGEVLHDRRKQEVKARWLKAKALVIDEISMIDGQFFDTLEYLGRTVKRSSLAFGGLQLVVTGDFFQLPPIERKGFAFEATKWSECFDIQMELTQVFRQADEGFVSMLNEIRRGMCTDQTYYRLLSCQGNRGTDGTGVQHTKLYPHKYKVTEENDANLESINVQKYAFPAKDEIYSRSKRGEDMVEKLGVSPMIRLCIGAQVMLLKNLDTGSGLVNGARGVIVDFCPADDPRAAAFAKFFSPSGMWPVVQFAGCTVPRVMGPEAWSIMEGEVEIARRIQVPLALAWALSVHKCQGMTLDRVETDLSKSFGYGMVYVALSRVKSLEGLCLRGFDRNKIQVDPKVKMFYDELSALKQ